MITLPRETEESAERIAAALHMPVDEVVYLALENEALRLGLEIEPRPPRRDFPQGAKDKT